MNELTRQMSEYRQCLKVLWNGFLAVDGDWDERHHFLNAAVELFRAIVLYSFEKEDREAEILPAYRSDKAPFQTIRVRATSAEGIEASREGTFRDTKPLAPEVHIDQIDMRYMDLYDFHELGLREFKYVKVELVASPIDTQVGMRLLIPFESALFERVADSVGGT